MDEQGRLYATDDWSDRVMIWEQPLALPGAAGPADLVLQQGGQGCDINGCHNEKGIAVAPNGDLWVSDLELGKHRLQHRRPRSEVALHAG